MIVWRVKKQNDKRMMDEENREDRRIKSKR
jgi:hypothetical protein